MLGQGDAWTEAGIVFQYRYRTNSEKRCSEKERDKEPIQDNNMEPRDSNAKRARQYLERLSNLGKDKDLDIVEVRSKGLSGEEKVILLDAMHRALRRIRHQRRKGERQHYVLLYTRLE